MFRITAITCSLLILSTAFPVYADASDKEALTNTLVELSGLEEVTRQVAPHVVAQLERRRSQLHQELYQIFVPVFRDAYQADKLLHTVYPSVARELDVQTMQHALVWLRSDLGRKITRLEEATSSPEAFQKMQGFAQQLELDGSTRRRVELAQRVDAATQATEMSVTMVTSTMAAVVTALDAIQPKDQRMGAKGLKQQIEQQRTQLRQAYEQVTLVSFLYTYQALSEEELERFLEFLESEVGRRYNKALATALTEALVDASSKASESLAPAMRQYLNSRGVKTKH
jgi:hypothetical protein